MYSGGHGSYPFYDLPPYWEAIIFGGIGILWFWLFFLFAEDKPLERRWKILVVSLLLSLLSVSCAIEGNSSPTNPWTQAATGFGMRPSYTTPHWLNDTIGALGLLLLVLLARDYQWLTWVRLWLDTFVLNKPLPDTSPKPRR